MSPKNSHSPGLKRTKKKPKSQPKTVSRKKKQVKKRAVSARKAAAKSSSKTPRVRQRVKQAKNSVKTRWASTKSRADYIKPWMWKPGQSGNPKGRPKTNPITAVYRDILEAQIPDDPDGRTFAQAIAQAMLQDALLGDVKATREITDRVEGKPKQTVELTNPTDKPLQLEITSALDKAYGTGADKGAEPESQTESP